MIIDYCLALFGTGFNQTDQGCIVAIDIDIALP